VITESADRRVAALTRFAAAITLFNIVGHLWLGFEQSIAHPVVAVLTAYAVELLLETLEAWAQRRPRRYAGGVRAVVLFLLPAHITGIASAMLLYTHARLAPIVFAVVAAIASKYLFRVRIGARPRHFFNPSNFGITVTLLAFPSVGIAMPYMFTENLVSWGNWVLPLVMIASGTTLNALFTRRIPLILTWVAAFTAQAVLRSAFTDTMLIAALLPMSGVAFILFTFYMVTDPSTTPDSVPGQVAFGASVAAAYGVLMLNHIVFGLFFALSAVCLARGIGVWAMGVSRAPVPQGLPAPVAQFEAAGFAEPLNRTRSPQ
jgi:enediyne biosynthesis protein E5